MTIIATISFGETLEYSRASEIHDGIFAHSYSRTEGWTLEAIEVHFNVEHVSFVLAGITAESRKERIGHHLHPSLGGKIRHLHTLGASGNLFIFYLFFPTRTR